ncbi:MAG: hypothetical protein CMJ88_07515 [Planctomycetes bacterium]|nr:hypothetical protein [Planctomycetota bacterium]
MIPCPKLPLRWLAVCAALSLCRLTPGQELMELRLNDGRVLVGVVRSQGPDYVVETREALVNVARRDVQSVRDRSALQAALKAKTKKSGDSAFARFQLAKIARQYGLEPEMWRLLDSAIAALPPPDRETGDSLRRRLRDFLAELAPELLPVTARRAPTAKRVQALLRLCHATTKPGKRAAIEELLVREPNADQVLREHARRHGSFRQRIAAVAALQRRETAGNTRFVLRTTVLDRSEKVRAAAAEIGRVGVTAEDVAYMASGLGHTSAKVRVRTASALGALGHQAAIDFLVQAGPHAAAGLRRAPNDAGASRGHIAFLNQQAYVRDFNVEVAAAAFIADPQIDVLQSGTVLDVTVVGVTEVRKIVYAYRSALKALAGRDPGPDPRAWATWRERLPPKTKPARTRAR